MTPNVRAFLRLIRHTEGTGQTERAYRTLFGGGTFEGFDDHPRKALTFKLGGRDLTSTAAGAYQFLSRTWDECRDALGLPDFSPASQDKAAIFLIRRRKALEDVIEGRLDDAIAKCAREWASLPGSPYGQPVKTLEECRRVYQEHGGTINAPSLSAASQEAPLTVGDGDGAPSKEKPVAPIIAAVLPTLIEQIPKLGRIFGSGTEVAERNIKAAEVVVEAVKTATNAVNAQDAAEKVQNSPEARAAAEKAIEAIWYELTEAGGGGIEGARKANTALMESGAPPWRNPAFVMSLILVVMPMMLLVDVLFVHPEHYAGELRVQIVTAVLAVIAMVAGYWIGTSFSSARKDERRAS